jgi:tetratricopeptide (TPR) repeat protein
MRCPACRADNDDKPFCRRCKADLSLLWAVEERRGEFLRAARLCLRLGQFDKALDHLGQVQELRRDADADQLAAIAHLLAGNFSEALRLHQAV